MATTCVSLQLTTCPPVLPSRTLPLPCEDPKPVPVIVTEVPEIPEMGLILAICSVFTVNGTALLNTPLCRTLAFPVADPAATSAITCTSLQLCTTPAAVPSHTCPLPCVEPKCEPVIVTCVPATPLVGDTVEIVAVFTLNATEFDHAAPCCT